MNSGPEDRPARFLYRMYLVGLLLAGLVLALGFAMTSEKIFGKGLIPALVVTYGNALLGYVLYREAYRGGTLRLLLFGLVGNGFRAVILVVLPVVALDRSGWISRSQTLVLLLVLVGIWVLEIVGLHIKTVNGLK